MALVNFFNQVPADGAIADLLSDGQLVVFGSHAYWRSRPAR